MKYSRNCRAGKSLNENRNCYVLHSALDTIGSICEEKTFLRFIFCFIFFSFFLSFDYCWLQFHLRRRLRCLLFWFLRPASQTSHVILCILNNSVADSCSMQTKYICLLSICCILHFVYVVCRASVHHRYCCCCCRHCRWLRANCLWQSNGSHAKILIYNHRIAHTHTHSARKVFCIRRAYPNVHIRIAHTKVFRQSQQWRK